MPPVEGRSLFAQQRQERLLQLLRTHGSIVVSEVAPVLHVTEMTIRRDVNSLAQRGLVTRVHGGATLVDQGAPTGPAPDVDSRPATRGARFTFGMVVPSLSYYWPSIIAGARAAAADAGARMLLRGSSYDIHDDQKQIKVLAETPGVDGLIVAPDVESPRSGELLRWLDGLPLPVVLAERRAPAWMPLRRLEWVASDHALGAAMAVQHLHAQGHRRIGLLAETGSPTTAHVRRGWQDELRRLGIDSDQQLVGPTNGFSAARRDALLDAVVADCRRTGTTALLVQPDPAAVSLVQHCLDAGLTVPDELAIVAYDDEVASLGEPPVTAVRPPKRHVGQQAAELLVARLREGFRRPARRVMINPEINVRESSVARASDVNVTP